MNKSIDDLPIDIFLLIIKDFNLKNKLKLRRISKLWFNRIENNLNIKELSISTRSKQLIVNELDQDYKNYLKLSISKFDSFINTFQNCSILKNLINFQILNLRLDSNNSKKLINLLNSFDQLENLIIYNVTFNESVIELKKLKYLYINDSIGFRKLELITPELKKIKIKTFIKLPIKFAYPESLEHIELSYYDNCLEEYVFENLIIFFYCEEIKLKKSNLINDEKLGKFILNLKNLNELHFNSRRRFFKILYRYKIEFGFDRLKIYLNGLLIDNPIELDQLFPEAIHNFSMLNLNLLNLYNANLLKVANQIKFIKEINYSSIEDLYPFVNKNLWTKFVNVTSIITDQRIQNENTFLEFLNNYPNILSLEFRKITHSQLLLDQIPDYVPFLYYFSTQGIRENQNFNFLFRLIKLTNVKIESNIDEQFIIELIKKLKFINNFDFKSASSINTNIIIEKLDLNQFLIKVSKHFCKSNNFEFVNLVNAIEFMKKEKFI